MTAVQQSQAGLTFPTCMGYELGWLYFTRNQTKTTSHLIISYW